MDSKIFDTLLEPVFILSADLKVVYCNEPASLICDVSVRKIMRSFGFHDLFEFTEPLACVQNIKELTEASSYQEVAFKSKASDKPGKAQITCQPFESASQTWILFFRDVTLEETLQKKYRAELEQVQHYSKNLERMVDERTAEVKRLNQTMSALLDSLEQGFFIFNSEGVCLEVHSKACLKTIENNPAGKKIWDVLKLEQKQVPGFQKWMTTLFAEMLPFEDLSPLGPQKFPHTENREIKLEYYPLKSISGSMDAIVVVASDITNLIEAQREAEFERAHAKMIIHLVKNRRQVLGFLREADELLQQLKTEMNKGLKFDYDNTFRLLHTLKGGASSFSIKNMVDICHHAENVLAQIKWEPESQTLLPELQKSSRQISEEFQVFQTENKDIIGEKESRTERWVELPFSKLNQFLTRLQPLDKTLALEFQQDFLFEPIQSYFLQYRETVQSVAENEGKKVKPLQFINGDLRISPEPYETLFSTFVHAYRNGVDHGIEAPDQRVEMHKAPEGEIVTTFRQTVRGGRTWLLIEVRDDGQGIDPARIRNKLKEKNIDTSQESDLQVIQHVFDSQFSTKEVVTDLSGRGVGMDAIQKACQDLGGRAWTSSRKGKGSRLFACVPWLQQKPVAKLRKAS